MNPKYQGQKKTEADKESRRVDVDAGTPIEQQLDMVEDGPNRGDEILHSHGIDRQDPMEHNFNVDMSEENREGDEMSGDEHSSGLQGGDQGIQPEMETGIPGRDREHDTDEVDPEELDRQSA